MTLIRFPKRDLITACEMHGRQLIALRFLDAVGWHCPKCGKYRWEALHGEAAFNESLISDDYEVLSHPTVK